jgi:hypothetical protein
VSWRKLATGFQGLSDLVVFEGIQNAAFVGYESLLSCSSATLNPAGGLCFVGLIMDGCASVRVCHASPPSLNAATTHSSRVRPAKIMARLTRPRVELDQLPAAPKQFLRSPSSAQFKPIMASGTRPWCLGPWRLGATFNPVLYAPKQTFHKHPFRESSPEQDRLDNFGVRLGRQAHRARRRSRWPSYDLFDLSMHTACAVAC